MRAEIATRNDCAVPLYAAPTSTCAGITLQHALPVTSLLSPTSVKLNITSFPVRNIVRTS